MIVIVQTNVYEVHTEAEASPSNDFITGNQTI